jgi:agmatinase
MPSRSWAFRSTAARPIGPARAGGLTGRELLHQLRRLDGLNIIGADVVETAPAYDHAEVTCVAAATVAFDLITLMSKAD